MRDGNRPGDVFGSLYLRPGTLRADGGSYLRVDYPRLVTLADRYNLWTTTPTTYPGLYGAGDGSTTFTVPDWRGVVSRYLDSGKGYDAGRVLGSYQADAIRNITGRVAAYGSDLSNGCFYGSGWVGSVTAGGLGLYYNQFDASRVVPVAAENRVRNIAHIPLIKY